MANIPTWPLRRRVMPSTEKVEKVVNPPQRPTQSNSRQSLFIAPLEKRAVRQPSTKQPRRLTTSVAKGK